jgi:SNF2 family DNA or RNA helicase
MLTRGSGSQGQSERAMRKLQALLKAILLRRMKTSLIDGKPLITLPPKTEEITHVVFSEDEQAFYNGLESKSRIQFNKYLRANTVGKNYSNILVLLLRLRQCCCHPHLITDFEAADAAGALDIPADAMLQLAEGLTADIINRLLEVESFEVGYVFLGTAVQHADKFQCPVCYDAVDNPVIFSVCGHDTCSECLTKISDQANQQNVVNGDDVAGGFRCPSCRANVEKNKILDYATFKKVHAPSASDDADETANRNNDSDDSDDDSTESESDSDTESEDDADGNGDLRDFIVPDDFEDDDEDEAQEGKRSDDKVAAKEKTKPKGKEKAKSKGKRKGSGTKEKPKDEKRPKKKHISIAMLKAEASKSVKGRSRYMRYLRKHWQPSAKVTKCVDLLEQFRADGQKTIVFSQFVSLLDLLEVPIMDKGWECERYDGSMSADARNDAINRFTDKPNIKIMLISLKAGNAGLNLVAASRVIILDPFWNPFVEMQAVDRAHRIGQQRPVEVHRILIQKTVEDRIIELQERKKKLVDEALSEGASKSLGRLGVRELGFLFGVEDGPSQQANDARTL